MKGRRHIRPGQRPGGEREHSASEEPQGSQYWGARGTCRGVVSDEAAAAGPSGARSYISSLPHHPALEKRQATEGFSAVG